MAIFGELAIVTCSVLERHGTVVRARLVNWGKLIALHSLARTYSIADFTLDGQSSRQLTVDTKPR